MIPRNTTIPTEKTEIFSTYADNQTAVEVHVLQGEREMAADNKTLGKFKLEGIPPAPRGVPQIEVTFEIDANGILNVSAVDKATGKEQKITITANTGLSDDEIDKMVEEAAEHAKEDKKKKEKAEVRNNADSLIFNAEKLFKESGDKIDKKKKEEAEKKIDELKKLIEEEDIDVENVKKKTEKLQEIIGEISQKMYEEAAKDADKAKGKEKGKKEDKKPKDSKKKKKDDKDDKDDAQDAEIVE
jgi:molecular chaperone DnaK